MNPTAWIKKFEQIAIIGWIDKKFDGFPYATNWLALVLIAPWLLTMIADYHPTVRAVAILWTVAWGFLIVWRFFPWLGRLERRWARRRKR